MSKFEIDDEILEMAMAREVDANRFYLALAGQTKNQGTRKVLEKLAEEELEHKAKLELEIIKAGRVVKTSSCINGFIEGLADYAKLDIESDYKNILLMGIRKEQSSFELYSDLAKLAPDRDSKEVLLALAMEEAEHKQRFQTEFKHADSKD